MWNITLNWMCNCMCIQELVLHTLVGMMVCRSKAICKGNIMDNLETWRAVRGFVIHIFQRYCMPWRLVTLIRVSCQHGACGYVTDWWWLGSILCLNKSIVAHHFNNRVTKSFALGLQNGYLVAARGKGVTAPGYPGATNRSPVVYLYMIRSIL